MRKLIKREESKMIEIEKCPCGQQPKKIYPGNARKNLSPIYICENCRKIFCDSWKWG